MMMYTKMYMMCIPILLPKNRICKEDTYGDDCYERPLGNLDSTWWSRLLMLVHWYAGGKGDIKSKIWYNFPKGVRPGAAHGGNPFSRFQQPQCTCQADPCCWQQSCQLLSAVKGVMFSQQCLHCCPSCDVFK